MQSSTTWDSIDLTTLRHKAASYPSQVPSALSSLEGFRLTTLPALLQSRKESGEAYLSQDELLKLVEWKLKHGTFRPTLMKLVSSNAPATIHDTTARAYASYSSGAPSDALTTLTKLSGIGPATASLILSVYDPANAPFFSDELFRYLHATADADGDLRGWDRKIGYTKKEYEEICRRVGLMRERLGKGKEGDGEVRALELEMTAYVLAREPPSKTSEQIEARGRKRKAEEEKETAEPVAEKKSVTEDKNHDAEEGKEAVGSAGVGAEKKSVVEGKKPKVDKGQEAIKPAADAETTTDARYPSRKRGKT